MHKKPLVSILIMTYNHEKFIADAINSCLNQTYKNIEICVGDDCSTDNTVNIVKKLMQLHPGKIKLVTQIENKGKYSLAINYQAILDITSGEFIANLDGDELMCETRIEKQVQFLLDNRDYVAVSNEKIVLDENYNVLETESNRIIKSGEITTKDLILFGNIFSSCIMMRASKDIIKGETSLKIMGDWYLIIRLSLVGKLGLLEEKLTKKIIHENNVTIIKTREMQEDALITLALIDYNYPEYSSTVTTRRILESLKKIKNKEKFAVKNLLQYSIFSILFAVISYIKMLIKKRKV